LETPLEVLGHRGTFAIAGWRGFHHAAELGQVDDLDMDSEGDRDGSL
jgi:hypothetical protein